MAARKTTTRTLRILRTVLLLTLAGFLVLVYALYRFGRAGLPTDPDESATNQEESSRESVVMAGEGFDYFITRGDTNVARIRARRVVSEEEDEVTLEGLNPVEIYREDGEVFSVTSDSGVFNLDTQATRLAGNVVLDAPNGLQVRATGLDMGPTRNTVISDGEITFSMAGEFVGRANRFTARLDDDLFRLSDGVQITSTSPDREPISLTCNRLTFHRGAGIIRAEGRVEFSSGESFVRSRRMVFHLTEDESSIRFISGRWGLTARLRSGFGDQLVRRSSIQADEFSLVLDPETHQPVEAEMIADGGVVRLSMVDETRLARVMTAPIIQAQFRDGELSHAEASGHVQLREFLEFAPEQTIRWACGRSATVDLNANGEIRQAVLNDRVEFRQGRSVAKADRVEMTGEPYVLEMVGEPARLINVQGELTAPQIRQEGEAGDARATGGVRGRFEPARGASAISIGGARGTIRVESEAARWNQQTPSFKFERNVRLWQDQNLLLAQEVETLTNQDLIVARGGVRTVLEPEREEEEPTVSADGETPAVDAEPTIDQSPVVITSESMEYGIETRRIAYHQDVLMQQSGRRMTCDDAEATLRESGGMETMHCIGSARIEDNVAGRTVSGEEAFYQVSAAEITFHGNPVTMTGDQGERVEGATLVYDLSTGAARVERATGPPPSPPAEDDHGPEAPPDAADPGAESTATGDGG